MTMNYLGNNILFKMRNVSLIKGRCKWCRRLSFVLSLRVLASLAETMCSRGDTWSSLREFKQESQVPFFFYFFGRNFVSLQLVQNENPEVISHAFEVRRILL